MIAASLPLTVLYGGSFDPVHRGHLAVLENVNALLVPRRLCLIPCHIPPHKCSLKATASDRVAMLKLAIATLEGAVDVTDVTIDERELVRDGVSYSYDTLVQYRSELGSEQSLCFVIGWDSWCNFTAWHRWQDLLSLTNLIVVRRPNVSGVHADHAELNAYYERNTADIESLRRYSAGKILLLDTPELDIASREVRHAVAIGESITRLVPASVAAYIESKQLYLN